MKFLRLIYRNLFHSGRRTLLTLASITVALFLFATLRSVITAFEASVKVADAARLITRSSIAIVFPLPISYKDKIAQVPGVEMVTWGNWFGGQYKNEPFAFAQFAVDKDNYFTMYPELVVPPDQMAAFQAERTACIVGEGLAKKFNIKLGDIVPITGTIYPGQWEFPVRGIYKPSKPDVDGNTMYFRFDYLDQKMGGGVDAGFYVSKLASAGQAAAVGQAIDEKFLNSAHETRSETEAAFQLGFISMLGNISFLVGMIGAAVIFAILLVTFNTMMMAARERTAEIAVMKTLGYTDGLILFIVIGEAILISLIGGLVGTLGAWALFQFVPSNLGGFVANMRVLPSTIGLGIGLSIAMGILSGLVPGIQASRLRIVDAFRQVG